MIGEPPLRGVVNDTSSDPSPGVSVTVGAEGTPLARIVEMFDAALWPAAFTTYTALIYLNREHFQAAGLDPDDPPETIDEMIIAARAIKAANVPGVDRPMVCKAQAFLLEWWLSGAGQELVNEDNGRSGTWATESKFDNPVTRNILTTLQEAKTEGLLDVTPGAEANADHLLAMAGRQSSFVVDSSAAASTVAGVIEGTVAADTPKKGTKRDSSGPRSMSGRRYR